MTKSNTHRRLTMRLIMLFIALLRMSSSANAQTITTIAGGVGNDTTASVYARLSGPSFTAFDGSGNMYVTDGILGYVLLRKLEVGSGIFATVPYFPALSSISVRARDASGNLYYILSARIFKITPTGATIHIGGTGYQPYSGDGSLATAAGMDPTDLAVDAAGNVYFADNSNQRIRKINTSGIVTTIAGTGSYGYSGDGGPALMASFAYPGSVAVDVAGNVYVADYSNNRIRKINTSGVITLVGGGGYFLTTGDGGAATLAGIPNPLLVRISPSGDIFLLQSDRVRVINSAGIIKTFACGGSGGIGDGGPATNAAFTPRYVSFDGTGKVYISDISYSRVRVVNTSGIINTVVGTGIPAYGFAGDGGNSLLGLFNGIDGIALDASGNVFFADANNNRIRKISTAGIVSTYAGNGIAGYFGDGGPATNAALSTPTGVALDKFGNLYIAEPGSNHIRKVTPSGIITTVAGGGIGGLGDGGPATAATLNTNGIALDTNGHIYVADHGNKRIRRIDATTGIITTVAGNGLSPIGGDGGPATATGLASAARVAVDRKGNIFIGGSTIRKVNAAGIITTLPATGTGIATDTMGNLYISYGNTIRRLDVYNYLSVVAGVGVDGYTGDNKPATDARIVAGNGMAVDINGRLYFSSYNGIRRICCLSYDIDKPPLFTRGATAALNICTSSGAAGVDSLLSVTDGDIGNTVQWTLLSGPLHGTLGGFPHTMTSTGGLLNPTGLTYTPTPGYTGTDNFRIKINDGIDTGAIQINVTISAPPTASTISGASSVCAGATITLFASPTGGAWSASNSNATVGSSGTVTGVVAGIDTITYTRTSLCGTTSSTRVISVNPLPYASIGAGLTSVCVGSSIVLTGTAPGGIWTTSSPYVNVGTGTGAIIGLAPGTALISYTVTNGCGFSRDSVVITVNPPPSPGILSGVTTVCTGGTTTLSNTVSGGIWSSGNPTVATIGSSSGIVTGVAPGAALISYTIPSTGCGSTVATIIINVTTASPIAPTSGPSSVCTGSTIILSNPTGGGTWSSSAPSVATISSSGVVSGITPGVATISYAANLGCGVSLAITNITVHAAATSGTISGPSAICTGVSDVMMSTVSGGVWSSSNTNCTISPAGVITGNFSGSSTISYTVTNSCGSSTSTRAMNIYPSATAGAVSGSSIVCAGTNTTYTSPTGTPGGVWSSSNPVIASITSSGMLSGNTVGTAIISYTVVTGCGISTATKTVSVNAASAGVITGTTSLCAGNSSVLASTVSSGTWSSSTPSVATIGSTGVLNAISGGTSVIYYNVVGICGTATTSAVVIIGSLPVVSPITGTFALCTGGITPLANATLGGVWSSSNTTIATVGSTGVVTSVAPGTTTISYMVTAGCGTAGVTAVVTVNGMPTAGSLTGSSTVCAGATVALTPSITGGTWSSGNPFVATVSSSGIVTGVNPGSVTISYGVTNTCGAALATKSMVIKVPDAGTISGLTTLCPGDSTFLTSTVPGGVWSSGTPSVVTMTPSGLANAIASGTSIISYSVTDACGSDTTTAIFTTGSLPVVALIAGQENMCIGSSVLFTNTTTGGIWSSSNTAIAAVDAMGNVSALSKGTCIITYSVTGGCGTASVTFNLNIDSAANPGIISGTTSICVGKTTTLVSSMAGGDWSCNDISVATISGTGTLTGVTEGSATISYTVMNSCGAAVSTANIVVTGLPYAGVTTGEVNVCEGNATQLSNIVSGGSWTSSNISVATVEQSGLVRGAEPGTSTISYSVTNECGTNAATATVYVEPLPFIGPITGKSLVIANRTVTLTNLVPGGYWSSSDTLVAVVNQLGIVKGITPGNVLITYTLTNSYGCGSASVIPIEVKAGGVIRFNIFPNPASRQLTITWENGSTDFAEIRITDALGRTVNAQKMDMSSMSGKSLLNITGIPDGVYTVSILSADGNYVGKVVIIE